MTLRIDRLFEGDPNPIEALTKPHARNEHGNGVPNWEMADLLGATRHIGGGTLSLATAPVNLEATEFVAAPVSVDYDAITLTWTRTGTGAFVKRFEIAIHDWLTIEATDVGDAIIGGTQIRAVYEVDDLNNVLAGFWVGRTAANHMTLVTTDTIAIRPQVGDTIGWTFTNYRRGLIGGKLARLNVQSERDIELHVRALTKPAAPVGVTFDGDRPTIPAQTPVVPWAPILDPVEGDAAHTRWIAEAQALYDPDTAHWAVGTFEVVSADDALNTQFSVDGLTGWHSPQTSGDWYMRLRTAADDPWHIAQIRHRPESRLVRLVSELFVQPAITDSYAVNLGPSFNLDDYALLIFRWRWHTDAAPAYPEVIISASSVRTVLRVQAADVSGFTRGRSQDFVFFRGNGSYRALDSGSRPTQNRGHRQCYFVTFTEDLPAPLVTRLYFHDFLDDAMSGAGYINVEGLRV